MDIIVKNVDEMTPVEYRACYSANYGWDGYMQEELRSCKKGWQMGGKVIMLWDGPADTARSMIGWALLTPTKMSGPAAVSRYMTHRAKYTAQFWVKSKYRRKGYGKMLVQEAKKIDKRPHVFPHDAASGELFSSFDVAVSKLDRRHMKSKPKVG